MEALGATTDTSLSDTVSSNSVIEIPGSAMPVKAKKKKKEEEEEELKQPCKRRSSSTVLLDLSLSNKNSDTGSSSSIPPVFELDLIGSLGFGGEGGGPTKTEGEPRPTSPKPEPRVFLCNYCHCKFYSFQSLGGHQNAHKRERSLAKHVQGGPSSLGLANSPMHHFPLLLHGAFDGQPLGIQMHSFLHKPSARLAAALPNERHGRYQLPVAAPVINLQPGVNNLFAENYGTAGAMRGATASFDHGGAAAVLVGGNQWRGSGDRLSDGTEETKIDLTLKLKMRWWL